MNLGNKFRPETATAKSTDRPRIGGRLAFAALFIALLALLLFAGLRQRSLPADIPLPADLSKLDPQLKAYILENAARIREEPRNGQRQATLGLIYAVNNLWPEARKVFANLATLEPEEPLAHLYFAIATEESGDQQTALRLYRSVTSRFPNFAPGFYRAGDLALRLGEIIPAEAAFQQLVKLAPGEWRAYAGLGGVKLRQGAFRDAVPLLEKAIQLNPGAKEAHHLLGLAYRGLQRGDDAERELRLGLNASHSPMPDSWSASAIQHMVLLSDQLDLATEYLRAGDHATAIKILANARKWRPRSVSILNQLGLAYSAAGSHDQARKVFLESLKIDPHNLTALVSLSSSCLELRRDAEAASFAAQAVQAAPDLPQGHLAQATVLRATGRHQEALSALERARKLDPGNAYIPLEMGDLYQTQLNQPDEALHQYQAALALDPASVPALLRLADLFLQKGQTQEAARVTEKLHQLDPRGPEARMIEERLRRAAKP